MLGEDRWVVGFLLAKGEGGLQPTSHLGGFASCTQRCPMSQFSLVLEGWGCFLSCLESIQWARNMLGVWTSKGKMKYFHGSKDGTAKEKWISKVLNQYLDLKKKEKKLLPTSNNLVALNSSLPASRLTSVAAVLKVSSIPKQRTRAHSPPVIWKNSPPPPT